MTTWTLTYDGYDADQEGLREALCTTGNGYFATRGAAPFAHADGVHYPGTYIAGLYDRLVTTIQGHDVANEDLVNLPNWLPLSFRLVSEDDPDGADHHGDHPADAAWNDGWFDLADVDVLDYEHTLDLRSAVVHSWVLARLDRKRSFDLFREALESDVGDVQGGTTQEGIHLGAMAGTVDLVQRGYTGLLPRGDVLWFDPLLPAEIDRLQFTIRYRRAWDVLFDIDRERIRVTTPAGSAIKVGYDGRVTEVAPGTTTDIGLSDASGG